jgi:hypothetical protein
MTQEEFIFLMIDSVEAVGIPYMLVGSYGCSFYTLPRSGTDVDFVIAPSSREIDRLLSFLGQNFYSNRSDAQHALAHRSSFNVVDLRFGWKSDFFIQKRRPFSSLEFHRNRWEKWRGRTVSIACPEDIILSKLEWDKLTPSEKQRQDAANVAITQGELLDVGYLRKWAKGLGVRESLEETLIEAQGEIAG